MATASLIGSGHEEQDSTLVMRLLRRLSLRLLQPYDRPVHEGAKRLAGGLDADTAALTAYLRGRHRAMQERVNEFFVAKSELQTPVELPPATHQELCIRQMSALVQDAGWRPLSLLAADPAEYFALMEALTWQDISLGIKFGAQFSLWGGSVINLGTKKHKEKYFDKIDNLDYPGCFAMTELHHGSNVQALQTTATFDPDTDEFIIDTPNDGAIKWWIGLASLQAKFAAVFARLILLPQGKGGEPADMGIHAFIVPIRDLDSHAVLPGIEINDCGNKIGLNGVDTGAMRFCSVRVPRDNLLNRFGDVARDGKYTSSLPTINRRFAATLGELVGGRVGLAYSSSGVLKVAVTIAVRYALLRQQFGPPKEPEITVLDYQSHQQKLMPMLASAYAFHFAIAHLLDKYSEMKKTNDGDLIADVHVLTSGLKSYISSYTAKSISICRESCGGHGYAVVNRFGSLRNDHDIFQTFEGDNTVLLQQVARDLLKQYQQKMKGGTLSVTWNYFKDSMSTYLSQPNMVTARWEGEDHLRDPNFQLDAFRYRTSRLLRSVAARLQKHMKALGGFGAWNRCLNHLLTLAESHIESVILARFIEAVKSCPDKKPREVLKLVCDLYALDRIWKDIGTYRNFDYVASNKAEAIHKLVESLSYQVRLMARELIDSFDLPDQVIRAPIGMQSGSYTKYTQCVGF